ncbi:hypothetical protein [Mesorhizobium marinum]|uniref:hypothetical protein n=1 Tax=Mesorhizobium marinum TaxID=3228790 RepID=UPI00346567BA
MGFGASGHIILDGEIAVLQAPMFDGPLLDHIPTEVWTLGCSELSGKVFFRNCPTTFVSHGTFLAFQFGYIKRMSAASRKYSNEV